MVDFPITPVVTGSLKRGQSQSTTDSIRKCSFSIHTVVVLQRLWIHQNERVTPLRTAYLTRRANLAPLVLADSSMSPSIYSRKPPDQSLAMPGPSQRARFLSNAWAQAERCRLFACSSPASEDETTHQHRCKLPDASWPQQLGAFLGTSNLLL